MDLSQLVPRKSANTKNGTQMFDIKFRRTRIKDEDRGVFEFSEHLFKKLNLNDNGIIPMFHPVDKAVVIRIVPNEDAVWFKPVAGKKTTRRASSVLEKDLIIVGQIGEDYGNHYLTLKPVTTPDGQQAENYYLLVDDENLENEIMTFEEMVSAPQEEEEVAVEE